MAATESGFKERAGGDDAFRWYVVQVYSGSEKKVKETLEAKARERGLDGDIEQVLLPTEGVVQVRRGARKSTERKFFPGYLLVRMKATDDTRHFIASLPRVRGFLGGRRGEAVSVPEHEMHRIQNQVREGVERSKPSVTFEAGEQVRVCEGPFASFNGVVEDVDEEKTRLKVCISIFGRPTPVDLDYGQVEKV